MSDDATPPEPAPASAVPATARKGGATLAVLFLIMCAAPGYGLFEWFLCRIEVEQGKLAVLVSKTGRDLPSGQIIAGPDDKGIRLDVLGEGRHFRDPFFWDWQLKPIAQVPSGKVGVVIRLFGQSPAPGKLLVDGPLEGADPAKAEKGILRDVLRTGHYRLNPYAYALEIHEAVDLRPGQVGLVTNLVGPVPKVRNQYVGEPGERGVQRATLGPGTHYVNPYAVRIDPIDVRQKRLEFAYSPEQVARVRTDAKRFQELSDHVAISFPSSDGFELQVKLVVTWQVGP